jgi:hypothetical protein
VLIPRALLAEVAAAAPEQDRLEDWIMRDIEAGAPLPGLYPPSKATRPRYDACKRDA